MSLIVNQCKWLYQEFGLSSLQNTGRDAWLIILTRSCRMFAYGTNSLIIALFFSSLKFSDTRIGLFMTLTLLGDVLLSVFLTLIADKVGRRRILFAGSFLMVCSGAVFALCENFWILLLAAVVGVISATGGDFGPFRAIEESILSHITTPKTRSDVLAWYVTTASLGSSVGTELSGRIIDFLQSRNGWTIVDTYHALFWIYSGMGVLNMALTLLLSEKCEAKKAVEEDTGTSDFLLDDMDSADESENNDESRSARSKAPKQPVKKGWMSNFSQISRETRTIMYKLWFLLAVDSLADGMVPYSLTTYYIDKKFDLSKTALGNIISLSYFMSSCSTVFAGPLARHLGLINTMVFTHLPSSAAVLFFPLPRGFPLTVALLLLRTTLNNMDQAPRSAFIAAVVKPEERTAVMGITSMVRTLASSTGPTVTGFLAGNQKFWIAFVAAGICRICYDLGLFAMFVNMKLHVHEVVEKEVSTSEREGDEEELREIRA
ncbi:major facilitator superfamily transporter [Phlyctema vagabunda]|uniref:Major facilitator superfamily transporter n=1 Tax=Phlyctema vagabunda TaxID=108571 RepID=A0ABR4P600_9HELO